jgi:predicted anti-sigma-YlaC factor YlaD
MNCQREIEVLAAVMDGRWPAGCEAELRAHAASCSDCSEVVLVAGALRRDHHAAMSEATVPHGSVVWFRAQRRARREALETARRTITAVQTGSIAAAAVVGAALIGGIGALLARVADGFHFGAFDLVMPAPDVLVLAAVATGIVLAPLTVWLLVAED